MTTMTTHTLALLPNEYWWGGRTADGQQMPYGKQSFAATLTSDLLSNQGCPFLVSSRGRYIWSEEPFDFMISGTELNIVHARGPVTVEEGHETLRGAYLHAMRTYFPASGKLPEPLLFQAPQYNLWIELLYEPTQDKVLQYARDVLRYGMAPGVIMIDDNWHEPYGTWSFHSGRFPDPKAMVQELHRLGFQVMLWVCPFVSPDSLTFRTLEPSGYLLRDETGDVAIRRWWNGRSAVLDCTNPDAVRWFHSQLKRLQDEYGIDGFKFDAGDLTFYKESDQAAFPTHPNGHCEAWARVGLAYSLNEYRACWKLAGQPLVQRLKDKEHTWGPTGLASLIPDGIASGLLGYSFLCPDMIGGGEYVHFTRNADSLDQELIVRYAQCSALFPMMQFSAAPWRVLDDEHLQYCATAAQLHTDMGEEIVELARRSALSGEPVLRHMAYVFPDEGMEEVSDQFMLGDSILVAPVLHKGQRERRISFPEGIWKGDDGSTVVGPAVKQIAAPLSRLPWYRRV